MDKQRDHIIFYRSFYDSIKCMPGEVQLELYSAVFEYWFCEKKPRKLSEPAKSLFSLMKPVFDRNRARVENGMKGGRKTKIKQVPDTVQVPDTIQVPGNVQDPQIYSMSFEDEVKRMKSEKVWLDMICHDFNISSKVLGKRLHSFLDYCKRNRKDKPHDSFEDAQQHLRYWMAKAFPTQEATAQQPAAQQPKHDSLPPQDYSYNGGFGGLDV